jgi:periplasmic protein CpxP/Spy
METQTPSSERRRRFFKRVALTTLIGGIAAGVGYQAFGHGGGHGWFRGSFAAGSFDPAHMDEHLDRMLKHLYIEIDATEEQKQRLAPLVKQAATDLLPLRGKMQAARAQTIELLTRDTIDRGAIEALRAEHIQLAEQASRRIAQVVADTAEVLTLEQRKRIAQHIERHRGHRSWGRG